MTTKPGAPAGRNTRTRQLYLTGAIVLLAAWIALPFLTPIAWAAILAIVEWPLFERATRRFPGRTLPLALGFTLATALLVILPLSIAAVSLAQQSQTALLWMQHAQQFGAPAPGWVHGLPLVGPRLAAWWQEHIGTPQGANALLGTISAGSALGWTRSIASEVARDLGLFLITLVILASLLARGQQIAKKSRMLAGRMFGGFGKDFVDRLVGAVRSTVIGTLVVSFGEGAVIGVAYAVAGVPQALLFATFTILLALIPFGAWAAFGLASLILVGSGSALAGALLFAFSVVVMTVGDNVIQPVVVGSAVELPVILAVIGAFGGLAALGLVGLFIGPGVMAALLLVGQEWLGETPTHPG
ncbi:MAG: AI-2E family transporter [Candidatus Andeanibacterium colombiense]|uniref:AI-2E family transporter n=1 Tax=Candidatus Andeanibacterium colombiense TaxID=3121345 RepID=A0AAJ5X9H1_9SPHN|nr:MAG: AI-2E family transporter [Sphingomonadaceae bacterium]